MTLPDTSEILIILFVMLLIFGAGKLTALGDALRRGVNSMQRNGKGKS